MASVPTPTAAVIPNGTAVTLHGLASASRYNGLTGTVTSRLESGRYGVAVMLPGPQEKMLSLKPANLSVVAAPSASAVLVAPTSMADNARDGRQVGLGSDDGADVATNAVTESTNCNAVTVNSLPGEVLQLVFAHCDPKTLMMTIPRVSHRWLGVCRAMRDVAINLKWAVSGREGGRWHTACALTDTGLAALATRFPFAAAVTLERCERVTEAGLQQALSAWSNLTRLELLDNRRITDISYNRFDPPDFPYMTGLAMVLAGCPNLVRLNLSFCDGLPDAGVAAIGPACPNLVHLNLSFCGGLTDAGVAAVGPACPNLTRLNLSSTAMTDVGLVEVIAACPNLVHFDLERCDVTEAGLADLAAGCPHLERLNLRTCEGVAGAGLTAVAKCRQIRHLDLSGDRDRPGPRVTGGGLEAVAAGCPHLEHLDLSFCDHRYDDTESDYYDDYVAYAEFLAAMELPGAALTRVAAACPNLEHLAVYGCRNAGAGLAEVAAACTNLKRLDLGCCDVTDADLVNITATCPNLEHLDAIRNCVTDIGLATLAGGCPNLHHLNFEGCGLTGAGLEAVAAGCPNIRHVNLGHCYDVTDGGLEKVATECPALKHLGLVCCSKVTDGGLASIAAKCPNLETLVLYSCWLVTGTGLALFPDAEVRGPDI